MNGNYGWLQSDLKKKKRFISSERFSEQTKRIHINGNPKRDRKKSDVILKVTIGIRKKYLSI